MSIPYSELQSLTPSAEVTLFVLDTTVIGGTEIFRFHAGPNVLGSAVVWQGVPYVCMPIVAEGFEWSTRGPLPRPTLTVNAIGGLVGAAARELQDLVGAEVTVKTLYARHLDDVNFPNYFNGEYSTADPTSQMPDELWIVEQKKMETKEALKFTLRVPGDAQNAKIPKRRILADWCPWDFTKRMQVGEGCRYAGPNSTCAKTLHACRENFGPGVDISFGNFPGTARIR